MAAKIAPIARAPARVKTRSICQEERNQLVFPRPPLSLDLCRSKPPQATEFLKYLPLRTHSWRWIFFFKREPKLGVEPKSGSISLSPLCCLLLSHSFSSRFNLTKRLKSETARRGLRARFTFCCRMWVKKKWRNFEVHFAIMATSIHLLVSHCKSFPILYHIKLILHHIIHLQSIISNSFYRSFSEISFYFRFQPFSTASYPAKENSVVQWSRIWAEMLHPFTSFSAFDQQHSDKRDNKSLPNGLLMYLEARWLWESVSRLSIMFRLTLFLPHLSIKRAVILLAHENKRALGVDLTIVRAISAPQFMCT